MTAIMNQVTVRGPRGPNKAKTGGLRLNGSGGPQLSENAVEQQIVDWLRAHRWTVTRQQSGLFARPGSKGRIRIGTPGMCDWRAERRMERINAVQSFEFEVKAPGKKPSLLQEAYIAGRQFSGFECSWFDSLEAFLIWCQERFE